MQSGRMISLERQPVTAKRNLVRCPLRDRDVPVERCLGCALLIDRDPIDPPRYVVCDARVVTGWLGLDDL
jgi:hypothetical protein